MKVLKFHEMKDEDYLGLTFKGASFDSRVSLETELEPFFQTLEEYAGEWMPDIIEGKRKRQYARTAIWKALMESRDDVFTSLGLYRAKWPALDMTFWLWLPPKLPRLDVSINVKPLSLFAQVESCRDFVEMVRSWASRYPVPYATAHSSDDLELACFPDFGRDDESRRRDGFDKIYEVFWLNVFGPKLVATVGRERMLSTPAHLVEELPNGSVLLVTWPTAAGFASDEAREAQARAHVHLRPDLDYDTVLRTLRARSARLTPVTPQFHPDVAPLLSRVVEHVVSHERQQRISELNAWQPPEPEEWRSADSALPPDVEDPARTLEHYSSLAELLVALLHTEVPSVFEATPESLTDVDFYFWCEEFPTSRLREVIEERAVPAIGAYLGQVLVRHLGGQWIPRENLMEAQVLVGNRVWLPFVRAHHSMRSRQGLLDCSLTQLYRVAERHRS